jgi:hypothetical protein
MATTNAPEGIIEKLHKIKALADKGVQGEATAAKAMLDKLLAQHGLTMEDLGDTLLHSVDLEVGTKDEWTLFVSVVAYVIDTYNPPINGFRKPGGKTIFATVKATKIQIADIKEIFQWYKPVLRSARRELRQEAKLASRTMRGVLRKRRKMLVIAMLHKHGIFPPTAESKPRPDAKPRKPQDTMALLQAMRDLKSETYRKAAGYLE